MKDYKSQINLVNEAAATYIRKFSDVPVKNSFSFEELLNNKLLLIHTIRRGIPFSLFSEIKHIVPFTDDDWAEVLNTSTKSLQRYKLEKDFLFKPIHSEKIIEIAEVALLGNQVFDTPGHFQQWLNTPCYALGSHKPFELLQDSYGKELVLNELNRIDHGIFA
jgi:putative toxin-antitoxin system antitoxin component (TIGR02293 family)